MALRLYVYSLIVPGQEARRVAFEARRPGEAARKVENYRDRFMPLAAIMRVKLDQQYVKGTSK